MPTSTYIVFWHWADETETAYNVTNTLVRAHDVPSACDNLIDVLNETHEGTAPESVRIVEVSPTTVPPR